MENGVADSDHPQILESQTTTLCSKCEDPTQTSAISGQGGMEILASGGH